MKKNVTLEEACKAIDLLTENLSEREACRKYCEKHEVHYISQGGFDTFYKEHTLRKKYLQWKAGKLTPTRFEQKEVNPLHEKVRTALKKKIHTISELSDLCDTGVSKIVSVLEDLKLQGFNIDVTNDRAMISDIIQKRDATVLDVKKMSTGFYKFGVCGDNHLCSKYERLDVLKALYKLYEQEGITTVYNTGNWIDGEARFNKHDLLVHGLDNQLDYFIANYPQVEGLTTYFITGDDHEGWYTQREGVDVGTYMEFKARNAGRTDLVFIGHMEADVILKAPNGETKMRVLHPGGGSSYAVSYSVQKIVESYQGGEKPDILFAGHYHKADYTYCRGVHIIQTGTTEDQTPFMRKKKLAAHLGGWIVEFSTDDVGAITRFRQEFIPFYDNNYYKKWSYLWG